MALLIEGAVTLPTWTPPPDVAFHLDTPIPCICGKPNMLLHELGYFFDEPELQRRVNNVFMPTSPSHTILVNTSGSGKTRLLLEGLCQNWGFYFTSFVDSSLLGSSDIQNAIQTTVPNDPQFRHLLPPPRSPEYQSVVSRNEVVAGRVFKRAFLARVLLFDLFIAAMKADNGSKNGLTMYDYKRKWLLLQLQPSILHTKIWDPFDDLTHKLSACSDTDLIKMTKKVLRRIRSALSRSATSSSGGVSLYCVIDEAQFAATQHTAAFCSTSANDTVPRPILRSLVQTISALTLGHGVFIILAGTGLSQSSVDATMASAVMKESRYRWCYDTGAFEGWDGMSSWVRRFVPDWVFEGPGGNRLKERMGYWLSGRHRFAAGYVTELLVHGYRQPHRLLNAYIRQFTGFDPTDGHEAVLEEEQENLQRLMLETRYKLDFKKLKENRDMTSTIHNILPHYMMRSALPVPLGSDECLHVEYGFARFKHVDSPPFSGTESENGAVSMSVAFDEPLVLVAAHRWINNNDMPSYKYFAKNITSHCHRSAAPSNGFENFIVYCIDLLFGIKPRRLKDLFDFHGTVPPWANLRAELVSLYALPTNSSSNTDGALHIEYATVKHAQFIGPSATLGTNAKTPDSTLQWLAHEVRAPVCFPSNAMGPDVLFVLRLANGKFLWVALQAKLSSGRSGFLEKRLVKSAVRSVTPKHFFLDKDGKPFSPSSYPNLVQDTQNLLDALPNRCDDAGRYGLLRAIASFPARADLGRCIDKKDLSAKINLEDAVDKHPIAVLNMELMKRITKNMSPANFLQSLEPSGKKVAGRKRKRASQVAESSNSGRKRSRVSLN
ncbi:hypothetical protein AX14_013518 [Amanita brunnescens Koide BX004]|nr:hypothetical protein AX14_013518 [Amanita brunnescens Koide BX004]